MLGECVVERLHAGRPFGELVVAEVRLPDAGRDDEAVVRQRERAPVRALRLDLAAVEVESGHLAEHDGDVLVLLENVPGRRGDVAGREDPRRHLVQQRLEEVMVRPVDERHLDRRPAQELRSEEPSEPRSDDDDPMRGAM